MSTISTILLTDVVNDEGLTKTNDNFSALNTDKAEISGKLSQFASTTSLELKGVISDETGSGALVFATTPTLVTPILGTPTSGTLTNCTGLPLSGVLDSTSEALGVGTLEVGNASDTTLSRSSAGVLAVEGVVIPTISSTNTITNKRITKRVNSIGSSATPTSNTNNFDVTKITGLAVAITSMTTNLTGTPVDGDMHLWSITDNGTARAITWGASFEASSVALPTTTVISTRLDTLFIWNTATSKWRCLASA